MPKDLKILVLNLPSPPYHDVGREWAGGFGTISFSLKHRMEYGQSNSPILQSFLPYFSSVLSGTGCEFKIIDCQRLRLNQYQLLRTVNHESPDVLFSLISLPSMKEDLALLKKVKLEMTNTRIIGMGTTCKVLPNKILGAGIVDVALRDSYPYTSNLAHLIEVLGDRRDRIKDVSNVSYVGNGRIMSTGESQEPHLGEFPVPSYDALALSGYGSFSDREGNKYMYMPIMGSKGCNYPCGYCPYRVGFGTSWSCRNPKDIVDEIEFLHTNRGIKGFLFRDQSFTMSKCHAMEVCDEITRRKLDIAWFCEARVNEVSRELLYSMKESGCKQLNYGVETGDATLIKTGKPGVNLDMIRRAFRITKAVGILAHAHVIIGWPDETKATIERTFKFVKDLDPDNTNWNILTPYPGTELYNSAKKYNLISTYDWSRYTSYTVVMKTKHLTESELHSTALRTVRRYSRSRIMKALVGFLRNKERPTYLFDEFLHSLRLYTQGSTGI